MTKFGAGRSLRRVEDARLLTGGGRFTDDINLPRQLYGVVVRSPLAHALIKSMATDAARAAPGVAAVLTGAELEAEGANSLPCDVELECRDGKLNKTPQHTIICADKVRFVGDKVAFVVAETLAEAKDAAELIEVEYEPLDAVTDTRTAPDPGKPQPHDHAPNNLPFDLARGAGGAAQGREHHRGHAGGQGGRAHVEREVDGDQGLAVAELRTEDPGKPDQHRGPRAQHGERAEYEGMGRSDLDAERLEMNRTGAHQRGQRHEQQNHPGRLNQRIDRRKPQRGHCQQIDY